MEMYCCTYLHTAMSFLGLFRRQPGMELVFIHDQPRAYCEQDSRRRVELDGQLLRMMCLE